jgi:hypothetical protein
MSVDKYLKNAKENWRNRDNSHLVNINEAITIAIENNDQRYLEKLNVTRSILLVQDFFFEAFLQIKEGLFYEGWCSLEKAESESESFRLSEKEKREDRYFTEFIREKIRAIQILYPYKIFGSPEFVTKKKCSICDGVLSPRNPCGHIPGKIYDRKLCEVVIDDLEFISLSMVENPVQKYSVPFAKDEKTGEEFDHYDYSTVRYLFEKLTTPFDRWSFKKSRRLVRNYEIQKQSRNEKCICGSGKKYKKCCIDKERLEIPHIQFSFDKSLIKDGKMYDFQIFDNNQLRKVGRTFGLNIMRTG